MTDRPKFRDTDPSQQEADGQSRGQTLLPMRMRTDLGEAIGRKVNLDHLPVLLGKLGAFGAKVVESLPDERSVVRILRPGTVALCYVRPDYLPDQDHDISTIFTNMQENAEYPTTAGRELVCKIANVDIRHRRRLGVLVVSAILQERTESPGTLRDETRFVRAIAAPARDSSEGLGEHTRLPLMELETECDLYKFRNYANPHKAELRGMVVKFDSVDVFRMEAFQEV